jgi:acylphosphatase
VDASSRHIRRHVWIAGRVQGVWFRESTRRVAVAHDVTGWVRNRLDGRVEAVFEGDSAAVEQLLAWCRSGPPRAVVTHVDIVEEPPVGETSFAIE